MPSGTSAIIVTQFGMSFSVANTIVFRMIIKIIVPAAMEEKIRIVLLLDFDCTIF